VGGIGVAHPGTRVDICRAEPITFRIRGRVVDNLPEPYAVFNGGRFEIVYTLSQPHRMRTRETQDPSLFRPIRRPGT